MKIDITFTHRGWFYGLPVYLAFERERDGFMAVGIIPFTDWWIEYVAPVIQYLRVCVAGMLGIETRENACFLIEHCRRLRQPIVRTFDWPEEAVRDYRGGGEL